MENTKRMNSLLNEKKDEDYKFRELGPIMQVIKKRKYQSGTTTIQSEMDYINRHDPHYYIGGQLVSLKDIKEERDKTIALADNFMGCIVNKSIKIGDIVPELYYIVHVKALEPYDKSFDSDMCLLEIFIETDIYGKRNGRADLVDDKFFVSVSDINELGNKYDIKSFKELTKDSLKTVDMSKIVIAINSEDYPIENERNKER